MSNLGRRAFVCPRAFGSPVDADHFHTLALLPGGEVVVGNTDGTLGNQTSSGRKDVKLLKYASLAETNSEVQAAVRRSGRDGTI
jgi:hypothetical protein